VNKQANSSGIRERRDFANFCGAPV